MLNAWKKCVLSNQVLTMTKVKHNKRLKKNLIIFINILSLCGEHIDTKLASKKT